MDGEREVERLRAMCEEALEPHLEMRPDWWAEKAVRLARALLSRLTSRDSVRNEALEEAAKIADAEIEKIRPQIGKMLSANTKGEIAAQIAHNVRALKSSASPDMKHKKE